jgi:transcriptional regulator with XRE-family HTH domain
VSTEKQRVTFGATVRRLREARGWSQNDLASRLGVTGGAVAQWEQGATGPREQNVVQLEELFDTPGQLGWIIGQGPPPAVHSPEDAIEADPRIPEHHKRTLLAHLAEIRRIASGPS